MNRALDHIYGIAMPVLALSVVALMTMLGLKFFDRYQLKFKPKAAALSNYETSKFARHPVITYGKSQFAVVATNLNADAKRNQVILRNLKNSEWATVRAGERVFQGPRIVKIERERLILEDNGHILVIHLQN